MLSEEQIIEGCRKYRKSAQKALYEKYSPVLRPICLRYMHSRFDAEDVLHECFIKIFTSFRQYQGKGSFEGWLKRIVINTSINQCKQRMKSLHHEDVTEMKIAAEDEDKSALEVDIREDTDERMIIMNSGLSKDDILDAISHLPDGYRVVFNLYVLEDYAHKEISDMMNIDVNTSKSQLSRARKLLQKKLYELARSKALDKMSNKNKNTVS